MTMSNISRPLRANTSSASLAPAIPLPMITSFRFCDTASPLRQSSTKPHEESRRCNQSLVSLSVPLWMRFSFFKFLNSDRADLELRHAAYGVERGIGQPIDRLSAAPVEWDENRVFSGAGRDFHFEGRSAAPRHQVYSLAVAQT